jgi:uroporphyrinogen decarboxylase
VTTRIVDQTNLLNTPFMKACHGLDTDVTPIWLMRQAGRYMAEYSKVREKVGFLELCKTPDLACEVTVTAVEKLGVDAAIIFADILLILEPMGAGLQFTAKDGPVINKPVRVAEDVNALQKVDSESLSFVFEAIKKTRRALPGNIPLIGFCGAPFTLASYLIEGGSSKHFAQTKKFMYSNPAAWHALLSKIVDASIPYLLGQVEAGAQVVQIFDSWVGCLSPDDYETYVKDHMTRLIGALKGIAPVIQFGLASNSLLMQMQQAGGDVIGLDWRVDLDEAWSKLGYHCGVQGNLDPTVLLSNRSEIEKQAKKILAKAANRPGHIFNLGHGVLPETPVDNVRFLVECVKRLSVR